MDIESKTHSGAPWTSTNPGVQAVGNTATPPDFRDNNILGDSSHTASLSYRSFVTRVSGLEAGDYLVYVVADDPTVDSGNGDGFNALEEFGSVL